MHVVSEQHRLADARHRGAAMVLVTIAMALATAMAVALLTVNSVRVQCAANAADSTVAHYLAESGANIAMYYLSNPSKYSGSKPEGFYPGEDPVPMGTGVPGRVATQVKYEPATQVYSLTTIAQISTKAQNTYSRQLDATLKVIDGSAAQIETPVDALVTNGNISLTPSTTIDGSVKSLGSVTVSAGTVTGNVSADTITVSGTGNVLGQRMTLADGLVGAEATQVAADKEAIREGLTSLVPSATSVADFRTYTTLDALGVQVNASASKLASSTYKDVTLGSTLLNPAGVYWLDQDLVIDGNTTINGTLILRGGRLRIKTGGFLTLRPAAGFPALVSDNTIQLDSAGLFTADGLVLAKNVEAGSSGATGAMAVNGALLLSDTVKPLPTASEYAGTIAVRYNSTKASVPGVGTVRPPAFSRGVKLLAWSD